MDYLNIRKKVGTKDDGKGNVYHGMVRYDPFFLKGLLLDEGNQVKILFYVLNLLAKLRCGLYGVPF